MLKAQYRRFIRWLRISIDFVAVLLLDAASLMWTGHTRTRVARSYTSISNTSYTVQHNSGYGSMTLIEVYSGDAYEHVYQESTPLLGEDWAIEIARAAQEAASHSADDGWVYWTPPLDDQPDDWDSHDDTWWVVDDPLPSGDEQLVAQQTADAINRTLARLFVRLGPPPAGIGGDVTPVSSGDGGSAR
ncbi:hypothetical protein AB0E25_39180 [Streptomyces bobili]|uniref:hypothetical protein n=1 Tax=Streptomyces bobili TaxID=67280 RepID=UPI00340698A1